MIRWSLICRFKKETRQRASWSLGQQCIFSKAEYVFRAVRCAAVACGDVADVAAFDQMHITAWDRAFRIGY